MPAELNNRRQTTTPAADTAQGPVVLAKPQTIGGLLEAAFGGGSTVQPIVLQWRLIRRNHWPFLLLPVDGKVEAGLRLYSAQRRRARLARSLFPLLFNSPASVLFERLRFEAGANSEFIQFLAQQSGTPPHELPTPAIKFGGAENKSRLVLMLCDESRRPVSVVKVGLDAAGRDATDREATLLEQLPANKIGCIRMTGRFTSPQISAFATAYYPGDSPADDAGMEHLFHAWLNPGAPVPLEDLPLWRELEATVSVADPDAWDLVQRRLAGRAVRTTLYHGDFAPWNIRSINTKDLQAFDWERGSLTGIPGWDWFHFIVQTAILARRLSVERVAAEMEQVLNSDRFKKYAVAAGINDMVKPLFLAALLHQKWVIEPLEGGATTYELFKLLAARWRMHPRAHLNGGYAPQPAAAVGAGFLAGAGLQLRFASSRLRNLFWEPTLNSVVRPSLGAQLRAHWRVILASGGLLAAVILVHRQMNPHLTFLPLYLLPGALATWKAGRKWGTLIAVIASVAGPLIQRASSPEFLPAYIVLWNMAMGFLLSVMVVVLLDRILQQRELTGAAERPNGQSPGFADNWAVALVSGMWVGAVLILQIFSNPHLSLLPLYMIPCAALTLTLGHRWGMALAAIAAIAGPVVQRFGDPDYEVPTTEFWNIVMRYILLQVLVLMVDKLLRRNILFFPSAPRAAAAIETLRNTPAGTR